MMKLKRTIISALSIVLLISCFGISVFAANGREYSNTFSTDSSVSTSTNNYGYPNVKMRADSLWSNNGNQQFELYLYAKNGSSYTSKGYCLCSTSTSGGTYIWYNVNTNAVLPKPAYFNIRKTASNSATIGGTIVSWSVSN